MKKNKTKFALVGSIVSLILCVSMLMGTTYAWFTDSVTSANNIITAGNLDVELDYWKDGDWTTVQDKADLFDPNALWEPGHTEVVYLKVSNVGTLALKYLFSINIVDEVIGFNRDGGRIKLSDYIQFGIVDNNVTAEMFNGDRAAAIAAVNDPQPISEALQDQHGYASRKGDLSANTEKVVAVVVWMPTTVGNEANHNGNENFIPRIKLGVNLLATQFTEEEDSFGNDYDANAAFGTVTVSAPIPDEDDGKPIELEIRDENSTKTSSFLIPYAALNTAEDEVSVTVKKTESQNRSDFEIEVKGLKEGNTVPVKTQLRVPAGLDSSAMVLTHKENPIQSFVYNPINGYVIFETTNFSPFAVEYDSTKHVDYDATNFPEDIPTADVMDISDTYVGNIEWAQYGPFDRLDNAQQLESAFSFKAPHTSETVENCAYKDWACDYVVSIDRDIKTDSIVLGGNYGGFGWVGFYNPVDISANDQIPLLGSFLGGESDWTYEMVVSFVGEFLCGVAEANNPATNLDGATFTVRLRLTNPADRTEVCDVNVVKYTFADPANNQASKIVIEDFTADITAQ